MSHQLGTWLAGSRDPFVGGSVWLVEFSQNLFSRSRVEEQRDSHCNAYIRLLSQCTDGGMGLWARLRAFLSDR